MTSFLCCTAGRDLLKKAFQKNAQQLEVMEAAQLFLYCFLDVQPLLDAHACLVAMTTGEHRCAPASEVVSGHAGLRCSSNN